MELTYFEWFSYEWAKACFKLNPNAENKKRLSEIKKVIREKQKCLKSE